MSEEEAQNQSAAVTTAENAPSAIKRDRSPEKPGAEGGEEDAFNEPTASKKPKFEKKSKKDFKPKSPYPGRNKHDRPQYTDEERAEKAAAKEKMREERRLAEEERMANVTPEDKRLPKRRCALLIGYVGSGMERKAEVRR